MSKRLRLRFGLLNVLYLKRQAPPPLPVVKVRAKYQVKARPLYGVKVTHAESYRLYWVALVLYLKAQVPLSDYLRVNDMSIFCAKEGFSI